MLANEQIIIKPIITEKTSLMKAENMYVFSVHPAATKIDVKRAVKQLFKVEPVEVNTVNVKGKSRRIGAKIGTKSDWKKAYVKIKTGQKIDLIEGML